MMANIILGNGDRDRQTQAVLNAYGVNGNATATQREAAEEIAVKSQEAYREIKRLGGRH